MPSQPERVLVLRERITDEIFFALGFTRTSLARRALGPLFRRPATHFAGIADRLETEVELGGLASGAHCILPDFSTRVTTRNIERVPRTGPLLIISNHPGSYDSVAYAAVIPRPDLKMVVSDVPFSRALENTSRYFIYVPAEEETLGRMASLRQCVEHLRNGGAVLMFARGDVEPDPAFMPGAADTMALWSRSIEVMLRKVPQTCLQVAIASGVLLPRYVHSPIVKLRKQPYHQQKLAETIQILTQMLNPDSMHIDVTISFDEAVSLAGLTPAQIMPEVVRRARSLLDEHVRELHIS